MTRNWRARRFPSLLSISCVLTAMSAFVGLAWKLLQSNAPSPRVCISQLEVRDAMLWEAATAVMLRLLVAGGLTLALYAVVSVVADDARPLFGGKTLKIIVGMPPWGG